MSETYDPDSMKALVGETLKEMTPTNVNAQRLEGALNAPPFRQSPARNSLSRAACTSCAANG